jgi:hypothetical protein
LKKYPYEFKIDDTLKIASIDGVEVSSTTGSTNNGDTSNGGTDSSGSANNSGNSNGMSSEQYETMQATIAQLQQEVSSLKTQSEQEINELKTELTESNSKINTAQSQIDNMLTTLNVDTRTTLFSGTAGTASTDYTITDISSYKYLIVYADCTNAAGAFRQYPTSKIINVQDITYNNSDTFSGPSSCVVSETWGTLSCSYSVLFWFKTNTVLHVGSVDYKTWANPRIYKIEGIK